MTDRTPKKKKKVENDPIGGGGGNSIPEENHLDEERIKKHKKQIKRMGKLLSTIWDASEPILQDGSGSSKISDNDHHHHHHPQPLRYLTQVGERLDDKTSIYHKVGKHGWEAFAKDIAQVYYYHYHHHSKQQQQQQEPPSPTKQQQQQLLRQIQKLFGEIHPDLEKIITEYPTHSDMMMVTSSTKSTTTTATATNSSSNNTTITNGNTTGDGGGSEYIEKERTYLEALYTFIQEQLASSSSSSSNSNPMSSHHIQKRTKQLLHGFRCRVTKHGKMKQQRYDVSYYNAQNRRFRSRVEVARYLQLLPDQPNYEEEEDAENHQNDDYDNNKTNDSLTSPGGKKRSATTITSTNGGGGGNTPNPQSNTKILMKRRRTMISSSSSQHPNRDMAKKRIRQEIEKLRKAHHRATKALDEYYQNNNNNSSSSSSNNNSNNDNNNSGPTASNHPQQQQQHHNHTEDPIDDRLLLSLSNPDGSNSDTITTTNGTTTTTTTTTIQDTITPPHHQSLYRRRSPDRIQFPNIPIHCTPEVIQTWDFLCTFHRALSLSPIELDDYVYAITYVPPYGQVGDDVVTSPVYIVEAHLALLKLLLQDKTSDDWWWSILETEVLQPSEGGMEGDNNSHRNGGGDDGSNGTMNKNGNDGDGGNTDTTTNDAQQRPVIRMDIAATFNAVEDPLITNSWLTTLEKLLHDKEIAIKRKAKVTKAIRTCLKLVSNPWIIAYLRKVLQVGKVNGPMEMQQAIRWLVYHVRRARPDLGERGVPASTIRDAREKVIQEAEEQMKHLGTSAPAITNQDLVQLHEDEEDESDDESDDDDDNDENAGNKSLENDHKSDTERPASVIPPKPLPTLVDLLLPPNKPQYNSELLVDAFSWSHIAGAMAIRILHRKKRLLNETDDAIRSANALPRLTVSERRQREQLAASRLLTEVENNMDESVLEKASLHLSNGGNYLDLSPQERLCILRILIEASYDSVRVYDVVSGNYKQRTGAMKALEVEQRRAKREAKEKMASDEAAARDRLAGNARQRFLDEQRDEIRKLNDKSKEFSDDVIESLTDEDIIDFDDDIKADYEALPGPESFSKTEVSQMITKLLEESAFETHDLQVLTMSELMEKEKREFEELEGRYTGFGGDAALDDDTLDRETIRTLQGLRREVERARTLAETLPDLRANALAQLKDALDDGRIKVLRTAYNVAKKAKLVGSNDETGGVWALDLMRDAALELEKAKQNKRVLDAQKDLVAKRNKCFIRTEPMGRDRYGTRFWTFSKKSDDLNGDDGTVWVETEFCLQSDENMKVSLAEGLDLTRDPKMVFFGAPDMEEDFAPNKNRENFLHFSRCEYHSSGFACNLALQHWGCHATEESLRSLIKSLDSRGIRENDLKSKLKEMLEETLGSGESEKTESLVAKTLDDVDADDADVDRIRVDGDEAVFIEAKDAINGVDTIDSEAIDDLYSGIGANVRIRHVADPNKDHQVARYENGTIDAWKLCVKKADPMDEPDRDPSNVIEVPSWRAVTERGRIVWLTGDELMESLSRFTKWKQGQGYFENDAAFFMYRNTLGKFCGKNSEAAYAASPYYLAKVMLKKEAELYPKLKTRNMENSWSGQNGARALWTNSMKDYAYDFQTVKQGLLTLENALFELTGSFHNYDSMDTDDEQQLDVAALLNDPATAFDIELESIEKNLPGLWNSPKVRTVYLYIVEQSTTTGFLALALDLLCRNTVKYLQTHNLWNVRGSSEHHYPTSFSSSSSYDVPSSRTTRRMNAWQQQQQQQKESIYY